MPLAFTDDARLARTDFDSGSRIRFSHYTQPSRDDVQDFIPIGVDFTFVRWKRVGGQGYNSYGHTVNPLRRAGLAKPRGDGQVAMNVQSVTGGIYEGVLVHRLYGAFFGPVSR